MTLAELVYEQARRALEQQERHIGELRNRISPLLTAAALTASFFGAFTLGDGRGVSAPIVAAGIALATTLLLGTYALYPHPIEFAGDPRRTYTALEADANDEEEMLLRAAFGLADTRLGNLTAERRLARCVAGAALALVMQIGSWAWAWTVA